MTKIDFDVSFGLSASNLPKDWFKPISASQLRSLVRKQKNFKNKNRKKKCCLNPSYLKSDSCRISVPCGICINCLALRRLKK